MAGRAGVLCAIANLPSPAAAAVPKKARRERLLIVSMVAFSAMAHSRSQQCGMIIAKSAGCVKGGANVARRKKSVTDNVVRTKPLAQRTLRVLHSASHAAPRGLVSRFSLCLILATTVKSVRYRRESIQFP